ncbi:polysaccharide ABC transporter ATP-binding protein [Citricoccus zhacaiensis]|uniref:Polysaccharide ABC transporter ATP-binding protein n=1 Tax=Citricoccus zhacaiensis TaxID=489142 RepID=A0ABQ2LPG4_9MICC|nr:ATP-binding cassette domain-containing protein [Citricoccus zhacaiensis]GGO39693.1 polysaccharide ABC transporter ATP-binding protein [Citricoccus zhacaiensis]
MTAAEVAPHAVTSPSAQAAVVIDSASMTYVVRSIRPAPRHETFRARLSRAGSGVEISHLEALKPLSLVVEHGESVGVIGTNGSGKSTLMKLVTGQLAPTSGSVYATDTPIMLGVNAALVPQISGEDNIILGCLAMGMSRAQADAKFDSIVELSGLKDSLHLPLKAYSSGMASRLQFAIATSVDPEILVIDEALNTGDAQFRERTRQRINVLREQAGCVFLVSHSLGTIRDMCTRAIWIERGELLMDGTPEEVTGRYQEYAGHMGKKHDKKAADLREKCRSELVRTKIVWNDQRSPSSATP